MDAPRDFIFIFLFLFERAARWGGGGRALPVFFFLLFFPCSADHERDWPPCKEAFFGLTTNALNVRNNNNNNNSNVSAVMFARLGTDYEIRDHISGFSRFWRQLPPIETFHSESVMTASSVRSKRKK